MLIFAKISICHGRIFKNGEAQSLLCNKNQNSGWDVKQEGGKRASGNFNTKQEAVQRGKGLAKNSNLGQIKIHG